MELEKISGGKKIVQSPGKQKYQCKKRCRSGNGDMEMCQGLIGMLNVYAVFKKADELFPSL